MVGPVGIIAPHPPIMVDAVGGDRALVTRDSATALLAARALLRDFAPDVLVLASPHAPLARDAFLIRTGEATGHLGQFGAPTALWSATTDVELAHAVLSEARTAGLPAASLEEVAGSVTVDHGAVVPLSFLDPAGDFRFLGVSLSYLPGEDHFEFGRILRQAADRLGRRVAFVASGDLSHRLAPDGPAGYSPRGKEFDRVLVDTVRSGRLDGLLEIDAALVADAGECGLRSFMILGGFLRDREVATRVLAYEAPWGVGYLTAVVGGQDVLSALDAMSGQKGGRPGDVESPPVALARAAIEAYILRGTVRGPSDEPALARPAAAFVSLHRAGDLRGCIGTTEPTTPSLGEEIVAMAIQAATQDPRFAPLTADELDDLDISVDVLEPPESIEGTDDLDPAEYGVIVSSHWRRGLLLPALRGIDTPDQQLAIARRKAGIGPDEPVELERFRVERFQ